MSNKTTIIEKKYDVTINDDKSILVEVGVQGPPGPAGPQGDAGVGIIPGGLTSQVLSKATNDDYDMVWTTNSATINWGFIGGTLTDQLDLVDALDLKSDTTHNHDGTYEPADVNIQNHIASSTIHFTEGSIDHSNIQNVGTNSHATLDSHLADGTVHYPQAAISITESQINDFGTYEPANANIQSHIASSTIHFTQAEITILEAQIVDLQAYILADSVDTLTNKSLDDFSNTIHADGVHRYVKNANGTVINKGQPVAFSGYNVGEDAIEVVLADNTAGVAIGVAEEQLAIGGFGGITVSGIMTDIDTSSWAEGSILYINSSGTFTTTEPTAGFSQPLAFVLRSNVATGIIQILADYPKQNADDVIYSGTLTATKVNTALDELDSDVGMHTSDGTIHFTEGSISITESQISDLGTYEPAFVKNTAFNKDFGALVSTVCQGNDSRLSDARTPTAHTHLEADITDFGSYEPANANIQTHIADGTIHFTQAAISITESQISDLQSYLLDITGENVGTLADVIVTTPSNGQVLEYQAGVWVNADASGGVTDHTLLTNIGTNSHATLDSHLADGTIHFTQAAISITESQVSDLGDYKDKHSTVNTQTGTTYTLVLADDSAFVEMNNAAANTITVPPNSSVAFPIGTEIKIVQYGAGQTTVAQGAGVTIRTPETLLLQDQYSGASLYKRGTDEWVIVGRLEAA